MQVDATLVSWIVDYLTGLLQPNVSKTKELEVDLRRTKTHVTAISIQGVSVETVEDYKYLGGTY